MMTISTTRKSWKTQGDAKEGGEGATRILPGGFIINHKLSSMSSICTTRLSIYSRVTAIVSVDNTS